MKRLVLSLSVLSAVAALSWLAWSADAPAAKDATERPLRGLNCATDGKSDVRIIRMLVGPDDDLADDGEDNAWEQMSVAFRLLRKDVDILDFDADACRVLAFTDDLGTDLMGRKVKRTEDVDGVEREVEEWQAAEVQESTVVSLRECRFLLRTPRRPAEGATRLKLRMEVGIQCGSDVRETERKDLALKEDAAAQVGPFPVKVMSVDAGADGKPPAEPGGAEPGNWVIDGKPPQVFLSLQFTEDEHRAVKSVKFFDAAGEIPSVYKDWGGSADEGVTLAVKAIGLARMADTVSISVTYYNRVEDITVPITVNAGIGF